MSPATRTRRHYGRANLQKDPPKDDASRPNTGRTTALGRKVEKPRDPKAGGPSGQHDGARHDKKHANK